MQRTIAILGLLGIGVANVSAQTNDHFFRSWSWSRDAVSAREAGLANAVVGLADDSAAQLMNPAGLSSLPRPELAASGLARQSGVANLDSDSARTGLGFIGGGGPVYGKWAVGGFLSEPSAHNLTLGERVLADGAWDNGYLQTVVTEAGASIAWNPRRGVNFGARLTATHLDLSGLWNRYVPDSTRADLNVGSGSGSTQVTGAVGVLLELDRETRVGASLNAGASYTCDRTASSPRLGQQFEVGGLYYLTQPSWAAVGASRRLGNHVLAVAELDGVRYSEITAAIGQGVAQPGEYALKDAIEPRVGLEFSMPMARGAASWQMRGGLHSAARGSIPYTGSSMAERGVWGAADRVLLWAAGTSVVGRSWRIDVAVTGGDADRKRVAVGAALLL